MNHPAEVVILGKTWKMLPEAPTDDAFGECFHERLEMWINPEFPKPHRQDTSVHELVHAIEKELKLNMTEKQVGPLATVLLAVLRGNPAFTKWILS